jgi:membrane protein
MLKEISETPTPGMPATRMAWKTVWIGAIATAVLFTIGKFLIGLYLGKSAVGSPYGAAGSIIVIIVWVYYSAIIFHFGAEFTHVLDSGSGSPPASRRNQLGYALNPHGTIRFL